MFLTDAHDSPYKSVLACTNSAVADGAINHIRQPELNASLWADIKKNMVFGCSIVYQWLRILLPFVTCCSFVCFCISHSKYLSNCVTFEKQPAFLLDMFCGFSTSGHPDGCIAP